MDAAAQRDGVGPGGPGRADPPAPGLTVRAARVSRSGLSIEPITIDQPCAGEALLAPTLVALSNADGVSALAPPANDRPFTPGREFVARVVAADKGHAELTGSRVVASPDLVCGVCDLCRAGLSAHCRSRALLGTPDADGALRERLVMPVVNLVPIPDSLADDRAVFAIPLAAALHAARLVHLETKPYITVLGEGVEAILAAQAMATLNASVRIVSASDATLHAADRLGVRHRPIGDVGRRADQDVVIDARPAGSGLADSAAMVRPRGKIVLLRPAGAADHADNADNADLAAIVRDEVTILGCRGRRLREAVRLLERGEIAADGLISQRFKFARADAALRAAADPASLRVAVEI